MTKRGVIRGSYYNICDENMWRGGLSRSYCTICDENMWRKEVV